MKIGELARATGCTADTIRFYEKEGLLPEAQRTEGNYRVYSEGHIKRLRFIRNCRALDMSHDEVRALLHAAEGSGPTCGEIDGLVDAHLLHVNARIAELQQLQEQLIALRAACNAKRTVDACGILHELVSRETQRPGKASHLG